MQMAGAPPDGCITRKAVAVCSFLDPAQGG